MNKPIFFDRDLSWLSFNERVLQEATSQRIGIGERVKFLAIYSSNLEEFYRVRIPVIMALDKLRKKQSKSQTHSKSMLKSAGEILAKQHANFDDILCNQLLPDLREMNLLLLYNRPIPEDISVDLRDYFQSVVLAYLQPVELFSAENDFFPENNKIYLAVTTNTNNLNEVFILNIPSEDLPRFFLVRENEKLYFVFLEDIIRRHVAMVFGNRKVTGTFSFKVTRDAAIDLSEEFSGDLAEYIEKKLSRRNFGLATRLLHQPNFPEKLLKDISVEMGLQDAMVIQGGMYHNLEDLAKLPIKTNSSFVQKFPLRLSTITGVPSLHDQLLLKDMMIHTPYQSFDPILRFFNEAAVDSSVREIFVTLYRVATHSTIVNALISAAKNGKKVICLIELKARFDEANNIKWAKKMALAGIQIIFSSAKIKIHSKTAMVIRTIKGKTSYTGLLSTGNFNETTALIYTDHILMTGNQLMLQELKILFQFLFKRKELQGHPIEFNLLLVAPFDLKDKLLRMIEKEIRFAKRGIKAEIIIKVNNLEEKTMIRKLYEASQAGVKINLIVRGICTLMPGLNKSKNIIVTRIIDQYLEHGRIFKFSNNGSPEIYMGSADWMSRNINHRIEVCFPILDPLLSEELSLMLSLQLQDNLQAAQIDSQLQNIRKIPEGKQIAAQDAIYQLLKGHSHHTNVHHAS